VAAGIGLVTPSSAGAAESDQEEVVEIHQFRFRKQVEESGLQG
jgi:hypothetical protein